MNEPLPPVILAIREITAPQPVFTFHVLLNDEVIASNRSLTVSQSRTVRDLSQQFNTLFEQHFVPHLAQTTQQTLGDTLFTIWLADLWATLQARFRPGMPWHLVIASDVAAILNLLWELLRLPAGDFAGFHPLLRIRRFPSPRARSPPRLPICLPARCAFCLWPVRRRIKTRSTTSGRRRCC
jgi:hypothetical protein